MTDREPDHGQDPSPPKNALPPLEERVTVLTATVDQLQAEHDRDSLALVFLLGALCGVILIMAIEHRKVMAHIRDLQGE